MLSLKRHIRSFLRDESGLVLAEALITMPVLIWALVAMFAYWDVFRTMNTTQKAAYSIADLLSRQQTEIKPAFIEGLQNVVDFLTPSGADVKMRITSFEYDKAKDEYCLLFSKSPGGKAQPLTKTELQTLRPKIPILADRESVFIVETEFTYVPKFHTGLLGFFLGLDDLSVGEFIVTRPRHRRIVLENNTNCL